MAVPLVFLTVFDTTSPVWAAAGTALGSAHRFFTSPFMRAAVLAMSGTRRMYHYGSVQVVAMRLAKDALPAILVAPIICDLLS